LIAAKDEKFEMLLEYLQQNRGFDFTGYKRPSLMRRVAKRMQMLGIGEFGEYTDYLQVHPEEFPELFNTILINVTSFFRDPQAWSFLSQEILPKIIEGKKKDEPIRVWSAGCASGEEPYTIAILLAEALGSDEFRRRVKIYATDIDEEALNQARQAIYKADDLQQIPSHLREKYFGPAEGNFIFNHDLRRSIIFGRHDLVKDAPISRLDLLICRNTLMYFNSETQVNIIAHLHFALNDKGYLFLGKSELLLTHSNLFNPVELTNRIFAKVLNVNLRDRLLVLAQAGNHEAGNSLGRFMRLREAALDASPLAHIIIDLDGNLALANNRAKSLFGLGAADSGRPIQDLEVSYRPVEVRSLLEQAYAKRHSLTLHKVKRLLPEGEVQYLDVQVVPLQDNGNILGASITFDDVTRYQNLQEELQRSKQDLETAYEELQSTNEELETTNEELQSTVEEQAINDELGKRTDELNAANAFNQSIFAGLDSGIVVVDSRINVITWNHRSEDLWGLHADGAIGQSFLSLDIGQPVEKLKGLVQACLNGKIDRKEVVLDAVNRHGKAIKSQVALTPLIGADGSRRGVIMLIEELDRSDR
jgi:two-component system CheB/CheR fusion protein